MEKAKRMKVIGLTGKNGGKLAQMADVAVKVPESKTYKVQVLHLLVYHCLCLMLEECFCGIRSGEEKQGYGYTRRYSFETCMFIFTI